MTRAISPVTVLRRLRRELEVCIALIELDHNRRPESKAQGALEALRHVETFLRNQEPLKP